MNSKARRSQAQLRLKPQTKQGLQNKDCCDTRTYLPFLTKRVVSNVKNICSCLERKCPERISELWHSANRYRRSLPKLGTRNKKTALIGMDTMAYVV
ncbi:hypothetical protein DPMN_061043 [Dreissena polymorpha]|uniref:Uncharacterized protein n=1 Tax=Dreissena polymorpha TaxID=45954 RepID=A0A9D4C742_DREPO|nr:hypothetical protein DPMN_061043 [Dreissena polymorpha]